MRVGTIVAEAEMVKLERNDKPVNETRFGLSEACGTRENRV